MSFSAYSTTASANVTINGISIAEGCPAGNLNNMGRQLMADGRELYDTVAALNVANLMPKDGGAFTGPITQSGAGGYIFYANSALSQGPTYVQPASTALPSSPAEGTRVEQY